MARTDADYERTRFLGQSSVIEDLWQETIFFLLLQSNFVDRHYGKIFVEVKIFAQMIN
jgi:hypothetical protein